ENCAIRLPAPSRTRIVRPPFVSERPDDADVALKTCAQPKTGSVGLNVPPPKITAASPAGSAVPTGKVNRVVSVVLPVARVLIVHQLMPIVSLVLRAIAHAVVIRVSVCSRRRIGKHFIYENGTAWIAEEVDVHGIALAAVTDH